jgi:TonB-linked SusC/RagA family outer membrane protein
MTSKPIWVITSALQLVMVVAVPTLAQSATELAAKAQRTTDPVAVLDRPARLQVDDVTLPEALTRLHQGSGVPISFSPSLLPKDRRVSCDCLTITTRMALERLLRDTNFTYGELDGQILVMEMAPPQLELKQPIPALLNGFSEVKTRLTGGDRLPLTATEAEADPDQQPSSIVGTVVGARGHPLPGARVVLRPEGNAAARTTATDADGRFRFSDVPGSQAVVEVAAIGYRPMRQTVRVGGESLRLVLTESAVDLDDIVVTGTPGATEKRALGNSVSQVKATEVMEFAPITDVSQLVNGRAPGVVVQPGTGVVGSGPSIRIRGASSIALFGSEPLLYVDGIRVDNRAGVGPNSQGAVFDNGSVINRLNDFNPEEIESLEIIKGPAAAALYGTEASAGVIQIITKRGRAGGRTQVNAVIRQGANWFMNAEGRWPTLYGRDATSGQVVGVNLAQNETDRGTPMFRTGRLQGYGINVSGGVDRLRYFVGVDLDDDDGIEPTNSLRRLSGRSNLDIMFSDKVDMSVSLGVLSSQYNLPMELFGGPWFSLDLGLPLTVNSVRRGFFDAPPDGWHAASENKSRLARLTGGVKLQHRPTSWLTHRLSIGLDLVDEDSYSLVRNTASDPYLRQFDFGGLPLGGKSARRTQTVLGTADYGATATAALTEKIASTTSVGFQYYRNYQSLGILIGRDFPDFSVESISAAAATTSRDDFVENTTAGMYVQQQFGLSNRLFLTGALRADDNSAFGRNFEMVTYPKVSASWVLSEEPFWPLKFVNALKLRAAWGQSGQQPQTFAAIRTYATITGETGSVGLVTDAAGNADVRPERAQELEIGFDAGLFNDRLGIDLTFYRTKIKDAILAIPTIPSQGFIGARQTNAGVLENRGVEAMVRVEPIAGRNLAWEVTGTIAKNDNKILELASNLPEINLGLRLWHRVGYPAFSWFTRRVVSATHGTNGIAQNVLCAGNQANNNQPVSCATAPALFHSPALPKVEGSVSSTLTLFNRVRLYGLVDFKRGHSLWNNNEFARCGTRCREAYLPLEYDPIHIAEIQQIGLDHAVMDASFAKLREISASVALPDRWARALGTQRASITLAGRNLHTWTNWPELDPETSRAAGYTGDNRGFFNARTTTPQLAQFIATVALTF